MGESSQTSSLELSPRGRPNSPSNHNSTEDVAAAAPVDSDSIIRASLLADDAVPDGGYGWAVVLGCAVLSWWFIGTSYSWGVIQASLVQSKLSNPSTLSFVGSVTVASIAVLALVNARVVRAIGARRTGLLGVVLLGSGEVLSGFTTRNIGGLFVTAGAITGLGTRCVFLCLLRFVMDSDLLVVFALWSVFQTLGALDCVACAR
jgi:hypothetical protein